ncbi:DNA translocase FtsK 4TM domain-containing protein [Zavarzinia sp. CC-PAN008]|uniref:DNA translocase FtsK 4TM domain-containing protein n=1 Tax=Zavarzinia sp. CC-PAN008 TaxID=3243332 RepID=UPI003F748F98
MTLLRNSFGLGGRSAAPPPPGIGRSRLRGLGRRGGLQILPKGTAVVLRRRLVELAGLGIFAVALLLALSLASFHAGDPSFNVASDGPTQNLLGGTGAHLADILLQSLGLASGLLVLVLAAWAWRLVSHKGLRWFWLNLALLVPALALAAATAASLPTPSGWPLDVGGGGVLGGLAWPWLAAQAAAWGLVLEGGTQTLALGGATALVAALAMGLSFGDWRAVGQGTGSSVRAVAGGIAWLRGRRDVPAPAEPPSRPAPALRQVRDPRGAPVPPTVDPAAVPRGAPRAAPEPAPRPEPPQAPALRLPETEPVAEAEDDPPFDLDAPAPMPDVMTQAATPAPRSPLERRVVAPPPPPRPSRRLSEESQAALDLGPDDAFTLPPLALLKEPKPSATSPALNEEALEQNARMLETVLDDFGIRGEIVKVRPGPVVTLYELEPAPGTKSSRVIGLADDIARSMSAISARVSVVPGRNVIGIELPNATREMVLLRELLASPDYENTSAILTLALGKDIGGTPVIADLARMPHLLVAGTTGSGKSVAINTMILSLLYRLPPDKCKFIMIDPKMLELSVYDGIPHLIAPVVTEAPKAVVALKWTVREMEDRYRKMSKLGVRNLAGYNQRLAEAGANGESLKRTVQTGFDKETGQPIMEEQEIDLSPLPLIVVIVDEMADLMMIAGKEIEGAVLRLAQMARAAGIHLIMATQRPSVDVITGTIKANFPTRISFQVTSKIDSRTILNEQGAEQLLGQGDMLYMASGGRVTRVHGPFVSDREVEDVVAFLKTQGTPEYNDEITEERESAPGVEMLTGGGAAGNEEDLYDRAVALVAREGKASTSFIQRHLGIGYNRAAKIIEEMEAQGVVSRANHVGKREVLVEHHGD